MNTRSMVFAINLEGDGIKVWTVDRFRGIIENYSILVRTTWSRELLLTEMGKIAEGACLESVI